MDPPPDHLLPQSTDYNFDDLQWSDLCFTEEDMDQWSLVQYDTNNNEEIKSTSYEVNDSLKNSEEAVVLEPHDSVITDVPVLFETTETAVTDTLLHDVPVELAVDVGSHLATDHDVPVELAIDVSSHYLTDQVFDTREALIEWCQNIGRQLKIVIIIFKSEIPSKRNGRGRLILGCERGGPKHSPKRTRRKDIHKSSTKKCNCPFKLKGVPLDGGKWKLQVSCGIHNHELLEIPVEHDLITSDVGPVGVLAIPEGQHGEHFSWMTIYEEKAMTSVGNIDGRNGPDSQASPQSKAQLNEGPPLYKHIERNVFLHRRHTKQKEEDIVICECRHDPSDLDSACGEGCLNVLTSTECTPAFCPCGNYCKNQKFQKCEYALTKLYKSEGRGWGLLAGEDIKAGQFVIEYCGEVISCKEAKRRSQAYEATGLKDAYIIYLNATESIDATRKGSLARFINHSCQPNCETRKWTVLGEIRVGIFAKYDIPIGTELAYDYNFEWYGGAKVRCLCGASGCSEFLGAKSRGFQEATYLWEDDDDRYSIENVPIYDSEDDEPTSKLLKTTASPRSVPVDTFEKHELVVSCSMPTVVVPLNSMQMDMDEERSEDKSINRRDTRQNYTQKLLVPCSIPTVVEPTVVDPLNSMLMEMDEVDNERTEDKSICTSDTQKNTTQKNALIPWINGNSARRIYHTESSPQSKSSRDYSNGRSKNHARKQVDAMQIVERIVSKEAQEEILSCQEIKNLSASKLDSLYDEIRPAIEEHERDSQDSVNTAVAEKWIAAHCENLRSEFDFFSSIIKSIACAPRSAQDELVSQGVDIENGISTI